MTGRSALLVWIGLAVFLLGSAPRFHRPSVSITPFKASGIYALGEKAGWTIQAEGNFGIKYTYTLKRNNSTLLLSGEVEPSDDKLVIEAVEKEPGMLFMEVTAEGGKPQIFGAAVAPTKIKPVAARPADFDSFWNRKIAELKTIPENPVLTPRDSGRPDVEYGTIKMDHVNGTNVYGQWAKPAGKTKMPALLILQWASPPYPLDRSWIVGHAANGWLTLNIQPHNVLPTEPASYYQNLPATLKDYSNINLEDRERNYFVEMYLRCYRAVDYLAGRPDWDGKTLVVMGTSMGGQQSLAVAGLHKKITHMIVNVPAGCDLNAASGGRQGGYPWFPQDKPKAAEVAKYVDCANFAPNIHATSLVAMGFVDTVCPPAGIWAAYNRIPGPKEVAPMVDSPHNHLATPEQQRPFTSRSSEWLSILVKGEPLKLKRS